MIYNKNKKGAVSLIAGIGILVVSIVFLGIFILFGINYFGSLEDTQKMNNNQNNLTLINSTLINLKDLGIGSYKEIKLTPTNEIVFDHIENKVFINQPINNLRSIQNLKDEIIIGQLNINKKINQLHFFIDYTDIIYFENTFDSTTNYEQIRFTIVDINNSIPVISISRTLN